MDDSTSGAGSGAAAGASFGPWGALAGAVLGGILGAQQKKEQARTRKEQALINMYSPLFGKSPEAIGMDHNYTNTGILQGVMSGYGMGHQFAEDQKNLAKQDTQAPLNSADPKTSAVVPLSDEMDEFQFDLMPKAKTAPAGSLDRVWGGPAPYANFYEALSPYYGPKPANTNPYGGR